MTTPHDDRPEQARDEHLLAALRHAPDHGLTPPSRVTQAILAAAEQVHRAPAPAVVAPPPVRVPPVRRVTLAERLQALLAPRWAGSVAAGLVAALVVGLWYEEELPPPVSRERAAAPAANEARSPAPAQPSVVQSDAPAAARQPSPPQPSPPQPSPPLAVQPQPEPPQAVPPARRTANRDDAGRVPAASTSATAVAKRAPEPAVQAAADTASPPAAPGPAAPAVTAPPPSPAPMAAGPAAPLAAEASRRAGSAVATAAAASDSAGAGAQAFDALRGSAPPAALAGGVAAASPALTLLRRVRADAESRGAIWTWQPGASTTARSFDADAQAWLGALVYAARGRWVDVAERSDGSDAIDVQWWRNDEAVALLRIERQGLRWIEPSGRVRHAPMTADELVRLRLP